MENLKEVLMRVDGLSEEEATAKIQESKKLISGGESPGDVLVNVYGSEVERLETILNPLSLSTV